MVRVKDRRMKNWRGSELGMQVVVEELEMEVEEVVEVDETGNIGGSGGNDGELEGIRIWGGGDGGGSGGI